MDERVGLSLVRMFTAIVITHFQAGKITFSAILVQIKCDVLLIFGKEDPWCKPTFAMKMLEALRERPSDWDATHRYVELDNVGHCPNHEAPRTVAWTVMRWIESSEQRREKNLFSLPDADVKQAVFEESWGTVSMREINETKIGGFMDRLLHRWIG